MDNQNKKAQYSYDYPMPACTADLALLSREVGLQVLMIRRGRPPFDGFWALPGGFAEQNETIEQTAKRELFEETRVDGTVPFCIGVFSRPGRDPRGWVISTLFAAVVDKKPKASASDDANDAKWFDIECTRDGEVVNLKLFADGVSLTAQLNVLVTETPFGKDFCASTVFSEGIAFDHAEMLCLTLLRLGEI